MSWTDVFPVLSEEMVKSYKAEVTKDERAVYEEWFGVKTVLNPRKTKHTVCFSLFWKNIHADDPDLPTPTRDLLQNARARGLLKRFDPWDHYILPLLEGAKLVAKSRKDACFRIYLASDMEFLAKDFTKLGCEVRVMKSSSIRHNPGALWRYLALDEKETLVTFSDSDRATEVLGDLERTDNMARSGLGMWRVPWFREAAIWGKDEDDHANPYRPILGCQFGTAHPLPARLLMEAVHWNTTHQHLKPVCYPPGCGAQRVFGADWPDYGYDEWFLQTAIYPRIAKAGVLTFLPSAGKSPLLPLDIEYVSWANPKSEIVYFGSAYGCCGPRPAGSLTPGHDTPIPLTKFPQLDINHLQQRIDLPSHAKRVDLKNLDITGAISGRSYPTMALAFSKRWLAYRSECQPHGMWCRIHLCELGADLKPILGSDRMLDLPTPYGNWGAEDPRLFVWKKKLFLCYDDGFTPYVAELDEHGQVQRVVTLKSPAGTQKDPLRKLNRKPEHVKVRNDTCKEKHWSFFDDKDDLYLSYVSHPQIVFPITGDDFALGKATVSEWILPRGVEKITGKSNAVLHDGLFWQAVMSVPKAKDGEALRHEVRFIAFARTSPFAIKKMTSKALLVGQKGKDAMMAPDTDHATLVCSHLERVDDGWLVAFGQNDRRIRLGMISDRIVNQSLVKVDTLKEPKKRQR